MKRKTKSMKASDFTHECRGTSRTFGRNERIDIVFRGNMAGTDGNKIIYPSLDLSSTLDETEIAVSRGYIDHETGHLRYTDIDAFMDYAKKAHDEGTPFKKDIANGVEDPRMERLVMQDYEGADANLTAVANAVCRDMVKTFDTDVDRSTPWYAYVPVTLANMGRVNNGIKGDDLSDFLGAVQARMTAEQYQMCINWAAKISALTNTQDTLDFADEIFDAIVELEPKADVSDDNDDGDGDDDDSGSGGSSISVPGDNDDGDGDDDDSGSGGSSISVPGDNDDRTGSQPGSDGDDADGNGDSSGHDSSGDGADGDTTDGVSDDDGDSDADSDDGGGDEGTGAGGATDKRDSDGADDGTLGATDDDRKDDGRLKVGGTEGLRGDVTAALKDTVGDKISADSDYRTFTTEFDTWSDKTTDDEIGRIMRSTGNLERYEKAVNETAGKINVMRRKLEMALAARRDVRWVGSQKAGRLDPRRLVGAYNAEEDVYRFREEDNDVETAVTVLVDLSCSMTQKNKSTIAMQSVIAIAEALEKTHVQYEILGFCTGRDGSAKRSNAKAVKDYVNRDDFEINNPKGFAFTRYEEINMSIFKAFNQPLNLCRASLAAVESVPFKSYVCNCDGESLLLAYDRLRVRPEPRKVLMVLSDGDPHINGTNAQSALERHLIKVIEDIEADDVEVLGIGVVSAAVRKFYKKFVVVNNIKDLTTVALEQIAKILLGKEL